MSKSLEQRIEELEKKVAELESRVPEQPNVEKIIEKIAESIRQSLTSCGISQEYQRSL